MKTRTLIALPLVTIAMLVGCDATPLYIGFMRVDGGGGAASTSTTSTAGGAGGAGGALLCSPGVTQPCYSGPAGTEGQGICEAGTQVCAADGMSWGACSGEVLPGVEDCATAEDEDCDGLAPPCKGSLLWAKRFGDSGEQVAQSVAIDSAGNIIVVGHFNGTIDFGGGPMISSSLDAFVVKLDAAGNHLWSKQFAASVQDRMSVAVDSAGDIVVAGVVAGAADFGGGPVASAGGSPDIFVVKLDASGGHVWSKLLGDAATQGGPILGVDASGDVVIGGWFFGEVDLGSGPLVSSGQADIFVAKLDASGDPIWSRAFGSAAGFRGIGGIGVDGANGCIVAGTFSGTLDLGGGVLSSAGGKDVFVSKLDSNGDHVWSARFGDASDQTVSAFGVNAAGNIVMGGNPGFSVDFGGGALLGSGGADIFLVKLTWTGEYTWGMRMGDASDQSVKGLALGATGSVAATGHFDGSVDFGGGPQQSAGGHDAFLAKLDEHGDHLWSKRFGDNDGQYGTGVALSSEEAAVVVGYFAGKIDFGGGPLVSAGSSDVFIAAFAP